MSYITAEKISSYPLRDSISNLFSQKQVITRVVCGILNEDYVKVMASYILSKHRNALSALKKSDFFNQLDSTSKPETPKSLNRLVFQLVSAALGR